MTLPPQALLEISIAQLKTLAAFLAEEMVSARDRDAAPTPEARACKEILITLGGLIPKLQAARYVVSTGRPAACAGCEDD